VSAIKEAATAIAGAAEQAENLAHASAASADKCDAVATAFTALGAEEAGAAASTLKEDAETLRRQAEETATAWTELQGRVAALANVA